MDMLQHYCTWRCTLFRLIPHTQIQYGPLSLHVANTFCIWSPLARHILHSDSFWCLLPGLELRQVVPLFLLSDYLTTICNYYYYYYYYCYYCIRCTSVIAIDFLSQLPSPNHGLWEAKRASTWWMLMLPGTIIIIIIIIIIITSDTGKSKL